MKTKHILYLFIFIGITSCINNKEYFIFDEVIHYHFEQSQLEKVKTNYSENKNQVDTLFDNIFYNSYPISINDTTFLNSLDLLTSKKQSFKQENKLKEFRKIFRKRMYNNYEEAACEPLYRDVFIFKNKNKIEGIAKICFECEKHLIIGSKANTHNFGKSGEYKILKQLIENN